MNYQHVDVGQGLAIVAVVPIVTLSLLGLFISSLRGEDEWCPPWVTCIYSTLHGLASLAFIGVLFTFWRFMQGEGVTGSFPWFFEASIRVTIVMVTLSFGVYGLFYNMANRKPVDLIVSVACLLGGAGLGFGLGNFAGMGTLELGVFYLALLVLSVLASSIGVYPLVAEFVRNLRRAFIVSACLFVWSALALGTGYSMWIPPDLAGFIVVLGIVLVGVFAVLGTLYKIASYIAYLIRGQAGVEWVKEHALDFTGVTEPNAVVTVRELLRH